VPISIFTAALLPAVCLAAQRRSSTLAMGVRPPSGPRLAVKAVLNAAGLPRMTADTHIVPVMGGIRRNAREASELLLAEHGIYIEPINYPTVPRDTERLRITPTPYHDDALIDALAEALVDVWERPDLPL
jgi:5-aminolevulinate synthase